MKTFLRSFSAVLLLVVVGCGGAPKLTPRENPFKDVRVGDWAEYRIESNTNGLEKVTTVKNTITEVTPDSITLNITGVGLDKFEVLDRKDYNPYRVPGAEPTVRELGTGSEKIKVGGQEYDCKWYEVEITTGGSGAPWTYKEWVSKTVPLAGKVKSEMYGPGNKFIHTIAGYGRGN